MGGGRRDPQISPTSLPYTKPFIGYTDSGAAHPTWVANEGMANSGRSVSPRGRARCLIMFPLLSGDYYRS